MNWRPPTIIPLAILLAMCWISMPGPCDGRPQWANPAKQFNKQFEIGDTQCGVDNALNELCQRCAKVTKSNFAYPMCCADTDDAVRWCRDYIYFGIQ